MTENTTPIQDTIEEDIDFDEWLAGGERNAKYVALYARLDLLAQIDELEKQRVPVPEIPEGEESMGGEHNPNEDLDRQIEAIEAKVYASKREFRVQGLTDEESDAIDQQVRVDLKAEVDEAAKKGREEGIRSAKLVGITDPKDINGLARLGANELSSKVINTEAALRRVAKSTSYRRGEDWVPLTVDQVRALADKLGQGQLDMLADACLKVSSEVPVVTVPKS